MNKFKRVVFVVGLFFVLITPNASAATLVQVNKDWQVSVNVLSAQDQIALSIPGRSNLAIQKLPTDQIGGDAKVSLYKDDANVKLALESGDTKSNLDVTNYTDSLVEIEETPEKQKIKISLEQDNFQIEQGNIKITTKYPIEINPSSRKISLTTESGDKYLSIMPKEAGDIVLRSKTVTNINTDKAHELIESDGVLVYKLNGSKKINFFNITDYVVEIESHINASNGEIAFTNEAVWVKLLSFFLS